MSKHVMDRRSFLQKMGVGVAAGLALSSVTKGAVAAASVAEDVLLASWTTQDFVDLNIRLMSQLNRLPWFETNAQGQIQLRDDTGIVPIIDTHSHVGWSQGIGSKIDMTKRSTVKYFYDYETDQDVLFAQAHPTKAEGRDITFEILTTLLATPARNKTHTAANLAAEMDLMHYQNICLHPIEIPGISRHAQATLDAAQLDPRFIPFAGVHPTPWGKKKRTQLKDQLAQGAFGLKFHPEFQFIAPDSDDAMGMFEWCQENDILVYAHVGSTGSELSFMRDWAEPYRYERVLNDLPQLRMVFAHTGVKRRAEALAVAKKFEDRVWCEIAGQDVYGIQDILNQYDPKRILFGSDWPFLPLSVMVARALVATEGNPELRNDLLHNNAARLLGLDTI